MNFFPFAVFASALLFAFGPGPKNAPVGQEFALPIMVGSGGRATIGSDVVLAFDPKILSVTKIKPGRIYPIYPPNLQDIDNVHGQVRFSATVGLGEPQAVEGELGEVFFRAKKAGESKISFVWEAENTSASHLVPKDDGIDLLKEKPEAIKFSFHPATFAEKVLFFLQWVFSFDYLKF